MFPLSFGNTEGRFNDAFQAALSGWICRRLLQIWVRSSGAVDAGYKVHSEMRTGEKNTEVLLLNEWLN